MRCRAKAKHRQAQCRLPVVPGMTVCRFHGGRTPRGPALPQFKTGKYSKFLPARLAALYQTAEKDPELLSLRRELALVDARINELLTRVDTGESSARWASMREAWGDFRRHQADGDIPKMHTALARLDAIMERTAEDHLAWREIGEQIEQRRKLAMSETQRLIALRQVITAEQALALMGVLVEIITRHVNDQPTLAQIVADIQALIAQDGPARRPGLTVTLEGTP
jgi:hypothetical protein